MLSIVPRTPDSASDRVSSTSASVSSSVASTAARRSSVRGVITSRAFFSENSNTPSSSVGVLRSSTPLSWLCSTSMPQLVGRVDVLLGVAALWPNSRSTTFDDQLSSAVNGVTIHANTSSGGASQRATLFGMCQRGAARRQLAEHDVKEGHDPTPARRRSPAASPTRDGERHVAQQRDRASRATALPRPARRARGSRA